MDFVAFLELIRITLLRFKSVDFSDFSRLSMVALSSADK